MEIDVTGDATGDALAFLSAFVACISVVEINEFIH